MSAIEDGARRLSGMLNASGYQFSDFIDDVFGTPPEWSPCDVPMPAALVRCSLSPCHGGNHVANGVNGEFIAAWAPTE